MSNIQMVTLSAIGSAAVITMAVAFWHRYFLLGQIAGKSGMRALKNRLAELVTDRAPKEAVEAVQSSVWDIIPKPRFVAESEKMITEIQSRIKAAGERAGIAVAAAKNSLDRMKEDALRVFEEFKITSAEDAARLKLEIDSVEKALPDAQKLRDETAADLAEVQRKYDLSLSTAKAPSLVPKLWAKVVNFGTESMKSLSDLVHLPHAWPLLAAATITAADFMVRITLTRKSQGPTILQNAQTDSETALFTVLLFVSSAALFELIIWGLKKYEKEKWASEVARYGFGIIVGSGILGLVGALVISTLNVPQQFGERVMAVSYMMLFLALAFVVAFVLSIAQWDKIGRAFAALPVALAYLVACLVTLVAAGVEFMGRLFVRTKVTVDRSDLDKATGLYAEVLARAQKLEGQLQNFRRRADASAIELKAKLQRDLKAADDWYATEVAAIESDRSAAVAAAEKEIELIKNDRRINGFRAGVNYAVIKRLRLAV